tara:strand:- start:3 stop:500 length:498 start_codon:yes stop_codon:yes gene_type:complete
MTLPECFYPKCSRSGYYTVGEDALQQCPDINICHNEIKQNRVERRNAGTQGSFAPPPPESLPNQACVFNLATSTPSTPIDTTTQTGSSSEETGVTGGSERLHTTSHGNNAGQTTQMNDGTSQSTTGSDEGGEDEGGNIGLIIGLLLCCCCCCFALLALYFMNKED